MTTAREENTNTAVLPNAEAEPPLAFALTGELGPLVEKLRSTASAGYDEWRVQDPKDGSYCIAYSWPETLSPEREARAWLASHKKRFPDSQYAGFVVACVRVVPQKDRLLTEAAKALEDLGRELAELRAELAAERQACAAICRTQAARWSDDRARYAAHECAAAIESAAPYRAGA